MVGDLAFAEELITTVRFRVLQHGPRLLCLPGTESCPEAIAADKCGPLNIGCDAVEWV